MLNHACTILEQDFREVLFTKLRQGFPVGFDLTQAYNLVQSTFAQGRLQSADVETEKLRATFLVSIFFKVLVSMYCSSKYIFYVLVSVHCSTKQCLLCSSLYVLL